MALLRINDVIAESIVDGPGFRYVIFTQGCPHACPHCHNPQTHDFQGGHLVETAELLAEIKKNPILQGVTFSGGEPFLQPKVLAKLGREIKALGLNIVTYTGFTYETLKDAQDPQVYKLLSVTDILIDGPYLEAHRNAALPFRGSSNQRMITLSANTAYGIA